MSHRPYGTVEAVWTWRPGLRFAPASTPTHKDRVQGTPASTPPHKDRVPGTPASTPTHKDRMPGTPAWAIFVLSLREDVDRVSKMAHWKISTDALFT